LTYSTTRFGVYEELKSHLASPVSTNSLPSLVGLASLSGFLGGVAGNPADVLNVRMQHDAALATSQRRNYKNAIDGLLRITREEGWRALFRGVWPNSFRAVLMTASQLASYDAFKSLLVHQARMTDDLTTHFTASVAAGFVATTVCSPVDVLKTRLMSAQQKEGLWTLVKGVWRREGLAWVFKGWVPSFVRLGPHTVVTFLALEQHKRIYRRLKKVED
jgi:solute carrier family 25 (mitochondrial dicarboxylate transporter), member 10